jgi:hypothetical protein
MRTPDPRGEIERENEDVQGHRTHVIGRRFRNARLLENHSGNDDDQGNQKRPFQDAFHGSHLALVVT